MRSFFFAMTFLISGSANAAEYTLGEWAKFGYKVVAAYSDQDTVHLILQKGDSILICDGKAHEFKCEAIG